MRILLQEGYEISAFLERVIAGLVRRRFESDAPDRDERLTPMMEIGLVLRIRVSFIPSTSARQSSFTFSIAFPGRPLRSYMTI